VCTMQGFRSGRMYCWALFLPSGEAMATVARLVEKGKILPFIEQVLPFVDVPKALDTVKLKKSLGKLVIDVAGYKGD
jgi:NADPH:quinone reductase-like Zn-dependent oxidoreductase